jgi:hypothetical protein
MLFGVQYVTIFSFMGKVMPVSLATQDKDLLQQALGTLEDNDSDPQVFEILAMIRPKGTWDKLFEDQNFVVALRDQLLILYRQKADQPNEPKALCDELFIFLLLLTKYAPLNSINSSHVYRSIKGFQYDGSQPSLIEAGPSARERKYHELFQSRDSEMTQVHRVAAEFKECRVNPTGFYFAAGGAVLGVVAGILSLAVSTKHTGAQVVGGLAAGLVLGVCVYLVKKACCDQPKRSAHADRFLAPPALKGMEELLISSGEEKGLMSVN